MLPCRIVESKCAAAEMVWQVLLCPKFSHIVPAELLKHCLNDKDVVSAGMVSAMETNSKRATYQFNAESPLLHLMPLTYTHNVCKSCIKVADGSCVVLLALTAPRMDW